MEWITAIKKAIKYMEDELLTVKGPEEVADHVHISSMYLQRGFQIMTGFTIGEYIRNRRLYLAAMELVNTGDKIIDVALKYGYETPESFTKAFTRFHNATPTEVRKNRAAVKTFLPLRVSIVIQGEFL
ncbi:helix-turn-helix transcriptional regulator [Clostridium thermarum]|uniref:helix-turn-helix transcriptional regulator n=1 Tax=Clostridium thermarum TaxID=1716543 RepID=UPI0013D7291D|nr:AraC family transcriptional regulator [Clostridium thermarum]